MTNKETDDQQIAELLDEAMEAETDLLTFVKHCWWMPHPFVIGSHTRTIAARLSKAVADYKEGKSTFLAIKVCHRHGKSDLSSRAFPAWALGALREEEPDIILSGYGASLVEDFSVDAQAIVNSFEYQRVFPGIRVLGGRAAASQWRVEYSKDEKEWRASTGRVVASGITGAVMGKGAKILIVDDFYKNRQEAESAERRKNVWDAFSNDLMTRRAPASIVILLATPWHQDDLFATIAAKMAADPHFPQFETLAFPAEGPQYPTGYLFPERYPESWYKNQRATLGKYQASGLMDLEPMFRGGNMLKVDGIQYHKSVEEMPANARWVRFWDLASSEKELAKDDPDFTVGALGTVTQNQIGLNELWVKDGVFGQWEAPERDRKIIETAKRDGPSVIQAVESVAGYKDTYTRIKDLLHGISTVVKINVSRDKVEKVGDMAPTFEAGLVHFLIAPWNVPAIAQVAAFPNGKHDDWDDALAGIYHYATGAPQHLLVFTKEQIDRARWVATQAEQAPFWARRLLTVVHGRLVGTRALLATLEGDIIKVHRSVEVGTGSVASQAAAIKDLIGDNTFDMKSLTTVDGGDLGAIQREFVDEGLILTSGCDDGHGHAALENILESGKILIDTGACNDVLFSLSQFQRLPEGKNETLSGAVGRFAWGGTAGYVRCLFDLAAYGRLLESTAAPKAKTEVEMAMAQYHEQKKADNSDPANGLSI